MPPIHVDLTSTQVSADQETQDRRANVVQRLADLGQIDPARGEVNTKVTAWSATIGGVAFPLAGCAVELEQDGRALVTLVVAADSVSVGRSSAAVSAPATKSRPHRSYWGDPTVTDESGTLSSSEAGQ